MSTTHKLQSLAVARMASAQWCARGHQGEFAGNSAYLPITSSILIAKPEVDT